MLTQLQVQIQMHLHPDMVLHAALPEIEIVAGLIFDLNKNGHH